MVDSQNIGRTMITRLLELQWFKKNSVACEYTVDCPCNILQLAKKLKRRRSFNVSKRLLTLENQIILQHIQNNVVK